MQNQEDFSAQPTRQREIYDEVLETEGNLLNQTNATDLKNLQYVHPFEINEVSKSKLDLKLFKEGIDETPQAKNKIFPLNFLESERKETQIGQTLEDDFNMKMENEENKPSSQGQDGSNITNLMKDLDILNSNGENTPIQKILQLNLKSNINSAEGENDTQRNNFGSILEGEKKNQQPPAPRNNKLIFSNLNRSNLFSKLKTLNTQQDQQMMTEGGLIGDEENNKPTLNQNGSQQLQIGKKRNLFKMKSNKLMWLFRLSKSQEKQHEKKNYMELLKRKVRILIYLLRFYEIIKEVSKEQVKKKSSNEFKRKMTSHIYRRYTWFPIFPNDPFKNFWNLVLFFSLILMAFVTPFTVCIVDNYNSDSVWFALDTVFDIIFGFDIIINFLSAYQDDKSKIIQNYRDIIKNYVTGWFIIDIVAMVPFNSLTNGSSTYNKLVRLLRLPRLYNLAKLIKLNRAGNDNLITRIQDRMKMNIASRQLLNMFFMTIIASHLISCLWFLTARMNDFSDRTWVFRKKIITSNYGEKYITCLYWAFQTLFVIGYGDLGAFTMYEQIVSIIWMIFSVGFYSFVISNLSSLIIQANKKQTMLKDTLDSIDQIQAKCKLPPTLVKKIKKFYEVNYEQNIFFPFQEDNKSIILDDMWDNIKQEVILLSQIDYVNKIDIFKVNFIFTSHILPFLKMQKLKENEIVYRRDDSSEEIFFLLSGEVCLIDSNNDVMLKIKEGSMFGEVEVIGKQNRKDFCKCITDCVILFIDKDIFIAEMDKFENLKDEIMEICKMKSKLIDDARNKIMMKRLQTKLQKESNSHKEHEKRDSIFENQSGIEFLMQKKKIPNSQRHYYLFLKAYNKFREKLTKKKLNIVYSEMFEEDLEQKSNSEHDEMLEADQEDYEDEDQDIDSNQFRKMHTSKIKPSIKRGATGGKSYDHIFDEYQKPDKVNSQRTIQLDGMLNSQKLKKDETTPKSSISYLQNMKSLQNENKKNQNDSKQKVTIAKLKYDNNNNSENESQSSEQLDDFNQAFDQFQIQESNTNILQAKIKKIKNNAVIIQRLKQQHDLLIREVNIKKNILEDFANKYSKDTKQNQQENK